MTVEGRHSGVTIDDRHSGGTVEYAYQSAWAKGYRIAFAVRVLPVWVN